MEYSYVELEKMSDTGRKTRSVGLITNYVGVDQAKYGHARTFWKVKSGTKEGKDYNCIIEFHVPVPGGLFGIAKSKWEMKNFHTVLAKSDIRVHCSCPDFYWSGMKYNLGAKGKYTGALSPGQNAGHKGEPTVVGDNLKPDIRDPERKHVLCKHLLAIKRNIGFNVPAFMKEIKNFDNNIKINDEMRNDMDQGKGALSKDVELTEVSAQDAKEFIEPIIHTPAIEPDKKEEIEDNAEEIITDESQPVKEEPKEDKTAELISDESETPEEPEDVGDVIEDESVPPEQKSGEGAAEIIDEKNDITRAEEEPEEVEEETLEKDKKESNIPDPDEVLGK